VSQRYPPDEFDRAMRSGGRRGAHRPRQRWFAGVVPVLFVLAAVTAVAIGTTTLLSSRPPQSAATADDGTSIGPEATGPEPTSPETAAPPASAGSWTSGPSDTGTTSPGSQQEQVDRQAPVRVVNGTPTAGLARRGAELLLDAGWDVSGTGNYQGETIPTTVFYGRPSLLATARAVAADLGGAQVELDPGFTESLTVVLGADFDGA
jgi:LytR cell envelope-related transcriptional attenuator